MPSVGVAAAIAEMDYLSSVALDIDKEDLRGLIEPVFGVFTQRLSERKKQKVLETVLDSIYVIGKEHSEEMNYSLSGSSTGLNGHPVAFKRGVGVIEILEPKLHEKGYIYWGILMKLGNVGLFNKVIKHYRIAADSVAAFYLDKSSHGLLQGNDLMKLWFSKHIIPIEFQGKNTRDLAYKIGNSAKEMEQNRTNTGLPFIYSLTR